MKFNQLLEILEAHDLVKSYEANDLTYTEVFYDSKKANKNGLLICKGLNFKKEYLTSAINKGVTLYISEEKYDVDIAHIIVKDIFASMALLSEAIYDDKNKSLSLLGVTGTKGKTTTVEFIHNILDASTKSLNPYWTTIDHYDGEEVSSSHNTTPEIVDTYQIIQKAKRHNAKYFTLEVSSQASKLQRIATLQFSIGVFMNISYDHVSPLEHHSFNEYLECKLNFLKQCQTVFLYRNTEYYEYMKEHLADKQIYTFGDTLDCDFRYSDVKTVSDGITFKVSHQNVTKEYKIGMRGNFNVINACAAIAVASYLNISYANICEGLLKTWVVGRMNIYENDKCVVVVDYAHNKISAEALIKALQHDYPHKNIKLVFGCPGDRGVNRRKDVGEIAGKYASYIYLTAEDPQTKKIEDICAEIASYIEPYHKPYEVIPDREEAIKKAINDAKSDDVIAIIGKGDETYQIVNHEFVPYKSDVLVVEEALNMVLEH